MNEKMTKTNSWSSGAIKPQVIIGIVIAIVAAIVIGYLIKTYMTPPVYQFEIVSHNGVLGTESVYPEIRYNYTVYVKVKNVLGDSNSITVYCELTREDLTTVTKQKTILINKGEEKIVTFFFSNEDLKGKVPAQYKIYGNKI